jgi:hypothetical protein
MLTMRAITAEGFGKKERGWNETAFIEHWRETWETAVNRALEHAGRGERVDHRSLDDQRTEVMEKAEQARAVNDNVQIKVLELAAARLDRDPEPKIGHIAMALERRGELSERGQVWRDVVARNLDRFSAWIAVQRERLDVLWARMDRAVSRQKEQPGRSEGEHAGKDDQPPTKPGYTAEQRDRLLGRTRGPAVKRPRDKDGRER